MNRVRRAVTGCALALLTTGGLVGAMVPVRSHLSIATAALVLVVPVVVGVVVGGFAAGVFAVTIGFLAYDLLFIPPYYTLTVGAVQNWAALVVYVAVVLLVARVVARLDTARAEARRREDTIRRIFGLTELLLEERPLPEVLEIIVSTAHRAFALRSVVLLMPAADGLEVVARAGASVSDAELRQVAPSSGVPVALGTGHDQQPQALALTATGRPVGLLGIWGRLLDRHDRELMHAFANHLALTLERAQLREQTVRVELLEKVDRLQRALVNAVSHDLRTPLATIKMAATTLRNPDAAVTQEQRDELLGLVDDQADRLDRLVTNLLDLGRVQAGTLALRREPIAVQDLVADAQRGRPMGAHDVQFVASADDDLPLVDVDHLLIRQVLANLLDNAARHSPAGAAVTVTATVRDDQRVLVTVEDEGPGVPARERASLFDSFNGHARGGTGLGLSIVQAFLRAHGQDIWIEDRLGPGARFCFTLPISTVATVG
ncbi:MAG TPA: ATP-binding protein [Polyangiaceae bacterium]|nr:ATP-binding protein [Polyangiaceae bacterium]